MHIFTYDDGARVRGYISIDRRIARDEISNANQVVCCIYDEAGCEKREKSGNEKAIRDGERKATGLRGYSVLIESN